MENQKLRVLVIGAHPDDCDIKAGGTAAMFQRMGHVVEFVSVTNGDSGHQRISGQELALRRKKEAEAAGRILGIKYEVLEHRDGRLLPTLEARFSMIALIRKFNPDLILTHRPNDYHPDHRYTSQLVCDAAYMVTVPPVVPEVAHLRKNPVIAFLSDHFMRPYPFTPSVVVDIGPVLETVVDLLDCHVSQFYEWLPYNMQIEDQVPSDAQGRREFLKTWYLKEIQGLAERHRDLVVKTYGAEKGKEIRYIEAFEPCEYGSPMTAEVRRRLFPFLP